jgi:hypothetical protein
MMPMSHDVADITGSGAPPEVADMIMRSIAIVVTAFKAFRAWAPESLKNHSMNKKVTVLANPRLTMTILVALMLTHDATTPRASLSVPIDKNSINAADLTMCRCFIA